MCIEEPYIALTPIRKILRSNFGGQCYIRLFYYIYFYYRYKKMEDRSIINNILINFEKQLGTFVIIRYNSS